MFTGGHHTPDLKETSQSQHRSRNYALISFTTSREEEIKNHTERKHMRIKIHLPKGKPVLQRKLSNCLLRKSMEKKWTYQNLHKVMDNVLREKRHSFKCFLLCF